MKIIIFIVSLSIISFSYAADDNRENRDRQERETTIPRARPQFGQSNIQFEDIKIDPRSGDNKKNKNKNKGGTKIENKNWID